MKPCRDSKCERSGRYLSLSEFPKDSRSPDGRYVYCKVCCTRKTREARRRKGVMPRTVKTVPRRKHCVIDAEKVIEVIGNKRCTREQILKSVRLPWDETLDVLARLAFEENVIEIVRVGERRFFHLRAA